MSKKHKTLTDTTSKITSVSDKPSISKNWREYLQTCELNTENFNCETLIVVESAIKCFPIVDALARDMEQTDQSRIKSITQQDLRKLSAGKVNMKNLGPLVTLVKRLSLECRKEMTSKKYISKELQALLIKLQMLIIREKYLSHKENYYELKEILEEEQRNALTLSAESPKGKRKSPDKKSKENPKDKSKKKESNIDCDRINLTLDSRSNDVKKRMKQLHQSTDFIEPHEGIDLYFVISKMYDYDALRELDSIDVHPIALIDFAGDSTKFATEIYHITPFESSSVEQVRLIDISNFWRACGIDKGDTLFTLPKTCAYLRYYPKKINHEFPEEICQAYHDLIKIAYNLTCLKRLHTNYLESIEVLDVEEIKPPIKLRHMNKYNMILNKIPNELQSIPVILHALIEEVVDRQPKDPMIPPEIHFDLDREPPTKLVKRHGGPKEQMLKLLKKFDQKAPEKILRNQVTLCQIKRIQYGNTLEYQISNTPYYNDLKEINVAALKVIPPLKLFEFYKPISPEHSLGYKFLFHKWANDFDHTPINRLTHCIHAFYLVHGKFFKLLPDRKDPQKNISDIFFDKIKQFNEDLEEVPIVISKYLLSSHVEGMLKRTKFQMSAALPEDVYCEHFEEYNMETMIQMINIAYKDMYHFEYKFLGPHDTILLRFKHNKLPSIYTHYSVRSPVCFRDFVGYIVDSETDWLYDQENAYWKKTYDIINPPDVITIDDVEEQNSEDFIIPGSIKDKLRQVKLAEERALAKKTAKDDKSKKESPKKNKKEKPDKQKNDKKKDEKDNQGKVEGKQTLFEEVKPKVYEGYNLGDEYYLLNYVQQEYQTAEGIKVSFLKQFFMNEPEKCTIKVYFKDNLLLLHGTIKESLINIKPLIFHLNLSNGIVFGFGPPRQPKHILPPIDKCIATYEYAKPTKRRTTTETVPLQKKNHDELLEHLEDSEFRRTKDEILEKIKIAIEKQLPIFKICSSKLHKYQYVKRIKSHIEIPIGNVIKRLVYKPKLPLPLKRQFLVSQCLPVAQLESAETHSLNYDFKATLPTGLCIIAVQGTIDNPFYIKQGYIIDRPDLKSIEHEDYRCFSKGKVISFLKTGEVVTMSFDKILEKRQYGYFSSNVTESKIKLNELKQKMTKNKFSIHRTTSNVSKMEKKVKSISKKYQKHLIDLSNNYRKESRREALKKEKKIYKLSKKLYKIMPGYLPLLKLMMINEKGSKITMTTTDMVEEENKYFSTVYNDYLKGEILVYRQDGTSWFLGQNGHATTQFKDNTRITTWATVLDENFVFVYNEYDEQCGEAGEEVCVPSAHTDSNSDTISNEQIENFKKNYDSNVFEYPSTNEFLEESKSSCFEEGEIEPYVLYGINYQYEHPNYMAVTERCRDEVVSIEMPDNVQVKIEKDGNFTINLGKDEELRINQDVIQIKTLSCEKCQHDTTLNINIKPYYPNSHTRIKSTNTFLQVVDRQNKMIHIDYGGHLTEESVEESSDSCACNPMIPDRYFVLRRDLSGAELFPFPSKNRFIHTAYHLKEEPKYTKNEEKCVTIMHRLYKTYTEHLMSLYDIPLLGMINNYYDSEELFRSFDYDEKSVILLRTPIYIYERCIYHLYLYKVIESLVTGFYKVLGDNKKYQKIEPECSLMQFIKKNTPFMTVPEIELTHEAPPPIKHEKRKINLKIRNLKNDIEEAKKLLSLPKPKYFECLKGVMVSYVIECAERAMEISERRGLVKPYKRNSKVVQKPKDWLDNYKECICSPRDSAEILGGDIENKHMSSTSLKEASSDNASEVSREYYGDEQEILNKIYEDIIEDEEMKRRLEGENLGEEGVGEEINEEDIKGDEVSRGSVGSQKGGDDKDIRKVNTEKAKRFSDGNGRKRGSVEKDEQGVSKDKQPGIDDDYLGSITGSELCKDSKHDVHKESRLEIDVECIHTSHKEIKPGGKTSDFNIQFNEHKVSKQDALKRSKQETKQSKDHRISSKDTRRGSQGDIQDLHFKKEYSSGTKVNSNYSIQDYVLDHCKPTDSCRCLPVRIKKSESLTVIEHSNDSHKTTLAPNEKFLANDIIVAVLEKSQNFLNDIPYDDVKLLIEEKIENKFAFSEDNILKLLGEMKSRLFPNLKPPKISLLDTALDTLEEIKQMYSTINHHGKDYQNMETVTNEMLEEVTVEASAAVYKLLDSPSKDTKSKTINEIKQLIEKNHLSNHAIESVLDLTAKGLKTDIQGSDQCMIEKLNDVKIPPIYALHMIEKIEDILLNIYKPKSLMNRVKQSAIIRAEMYQSLRSLHEEDLLNSDTAMGTTPQKKKLNRKPSNLKRTSTGDKIAPEIKKSHIDRLNSPDIKKTPDKRFSTSKYRRSSSLKYNTPVHSVMDTQRSSSSIVKYKQVLTTKKVKPHTADNELEPSKMAFHRKLKRVESAKMYKKNVKHKKPNSNHGSQQDEEEYQGRKLKGHADHKTHSPEPQNRFESEASKITYNQFDFSDPFLDEMNKSNHDIQRNSSTRRFTEGLKVPEYLTN